MDYTNARDYLLDVPVGDVRSSPEALTLDTLRAARNLAIDARLLQAVLATDADVIESLLDRGQALSPESDAGRRALLLVRLHRALGDVYGSLDQVHAWLDARHPELQGRPRDLMSSTDGLARVVQHMEALSKDPLV